MKRGDNVTIIDLDIRGIDGREVVGIVERVGRDACTVRFQTMRVTVRPDRLRPWSPS